MSALLRSTPLRNFSISVFKEKPKQRRSSRSLQFYLAQPFAINDRRNLGRFDLTPPAPKDICVRSRDSFRSQMSIYRRFVLEQQLLVRAVRDSHDIDVFEFGASLAPIAVSQNVMPADFTAGLDLAVRRHRPMKQSVKARDPHPAGRWLDVFKEGRETPDDFARVQFFGHAIKFLQRNASFIRARGPWRPLNFVRPEFTL